MKMIPSFKWIALIGAIACLGIRSQAQTLIPGTAARPKTDGDKRGFLWRVHQVNSSQPNTNERTEQQLAGLLGANVADPNAVGVALGPGKPGGPNDPIEFEIESVINLDQAGGSNGAFQPDDQMPGIPGIEGSTDNIGAEILTWLELDPGEYEFIVNSDDGFLMTMGGNSPADKFGIKVGEFNGGRGASDTPFRVKIEKAGLYAARITWEEGGGGANIEFVIRKSGTKFLVNADDSGIRAWRSIKGGITGVVASKVSPSPGQAGVSPDTSIDVVLGNAASINAADVKLSLDGSPVAATVNKTADTISVSFKPSALFASGSSHAVSLSMGAQKVDWTFTVRNYPTLPPSLRVTADTSKPGFLWRVHQNTAAGTANNNARTERQLRGEIKVDGVPIANHADPNVVGGADKPAARANPEWAPITFEVSKVINFSQTEGDNNGRFTPDLQMPGIPGIEGSTDAIAAEILTFLELPAGVITMVVNSDDGFLTTIGPVGELEDAFTPPLVAGEFNGGRGAADTIYTIVVQEAGVYPFRTTWEEGGGGANIEWYTIKPDGTRVLVNDTANGGIKAYRAMQAGTKKAVGRKLDPKPGQGGIVTGYTVTVELADGSTPINQSTVSLKLDGRNVPATVSKSGNITTVTYKLTETFGEKETHTLALSYTEGNTPVVREWSFVTLTNELLAYWDFNDASDPSGTKDKVGGFLGTFQSGAKLTDDGKGRTGRPGDRAARPGSEDPVVNGHIRVEGAHVTPLNTGGKQNQLAISFWQRLDIIRNSSAFWAIGAGQDRAFQAHVPWGNSTIYFDTGGGCCDGTQRIQQDMTEFAGGDALAFVRVWRHFVFQKNGDTKQVWIDGKLFLEGSNSSPLPFEFTRLAIGSDSNGGNNTHGDIDDFAVFASALTPAEIDRLAKGASPTEIRKAATRPPTGAKFTSVKVSGGNIVIEWSGAGTLQSADSITGPWTDVAGAASPFSVAAGTSRAKFYRFKP